MKLKSLFLLGDIGYFNYNLQLIVNDIHKNINFNDALVLLGDNFYDYGISDKCDNLVNDFYGIFNKIENPIYSILGNHDYLQNPKSQINHDLWIMPDFYYVKEYSNVDLIFLDTIIFDTHYGIKTKYIENIHKDNIENLIFKELNWLEKQLNKNIDKKKIIFGHYPMISNGIYKEKKEDIPVYNYLIDLLQKYKVTAYISGHEHNIQYINRKIDNYNFNQIIVGSTAQNRHWEKDHSTNNEMYDNSDNFYARLVFDDRISIEYVNKKGIIIYTYNLD